MNWYKIAQQENIGDNQLDLNGLRAEARKYNSFRDFELAWLLETKHGAYWHITYDPNFKIDPLKGPSDTSSLATGRMEKCC